MSSIGHVHEWGEKRYVDHCHYVVVIKRCKGCRSVHEDTVERDFDLDPLQVAFARQDCQTCCERLLGSEPRSWSAA